MVYAYEARFEKSDEDSCWYVSFDSFEDAITSGDTIEDAVSSAVDLLTLLLAEHLDEGKPLPAPSFHEPPLSVVCVSITDDTIEETKLVTVKEAAELLGVSPSRISQLLSDGRLDAREFHGRRMVTLESINERIANKPAPHRPRLNAVAL